MATPEAALKLEIARLTGAINRHRSTEGRPLPSYPTTRNTYVNPSYKLSSSKTQVRPGSQTPSAAPTSNTSSIPTVRPQSGPGPSQSQPRDVTINGVVFETSKRSLVRKDIKPASKPPSFGPRPRVQSQFSRNKSAVGPRTRAYKPKGPPRSRLKLDNTRRAYQSRGPNYRKKYVDKPCPRFTTTGSCNRGLTCAYKHDPVKTAICWPYLQNNCPHTAETCALSHESNPHRTPLCVHFANAGRCTRANCQYPHVRVGRREGVCRDFAVLGYCEAGIECPKQHVRECPDFAENGVCPNKFCKLPHVIRANRARKPASTGVEAGPASASIVDDLVSAVAAPTPTAEDAQLGDEYISLTFNESEEDEESSDDDDVDEEDDDDQEEGDSPNPGDDDIAQD
ncbi:hypothetical protein EDB86DRAFT_2968062 [Lactarius hatsudake]|nr:hypothetical protein EDB86DRAFT_2968062 [Lactarius hatsudake]